MFKMNLKHLILQLTVVFPTIKCFKGDVKVLRKAIYAFTFRNIKNKQSKINE